MATLSAQLDEMRSRAEAHLSSTGSAQEVKADVLAIANIPLPLSAKYCHIAGEALVTSNALWNNGTNNLPFINLFLSLLVSLSCPSLSAPLFLLCQSLVSLQRLSTALNILEKYGCNLTSPCRPKYWRSVKHNNPVFKATVDAIAGGRAVLCLYGYTNQQPDGLSFPDDVIEPDTGKVAAVTLEVMTLRMELDLLIKVCSSLTLWQCIYCTTVNEARTVFCMSCERTRSSGTLSAALEEPLQLSTFTEWQCKSCTVVNAGSSVLCEVCERPRLATRPPVSPVYSGHATLESLKEADGQWVCQFCTFVNLNPAPLCEMCDLPRPEPAPTPRKLLPQSPIKDVPLSPIKPKVTLAEDPDVKRQKLMREQGLKLVQLIREGERNGVSPEEVYTSLRVSAGSSFAPCDWVRLELPHLLDEICAMAASVQQQPTVGRSGSHGDGNPEMSQGVQLSRAEAKQAWLAAGGDTEKAVKLALQDRRGKVKELHSLGFSDVAKCEEVLRLSGGEVRGALALLQRPLLESFHQRMWSDQPLPSIDIRDPDKQKVCRRLLAVYDLPSWGRCELALSLLQDPDVPYTLEDVVQAVKESHDRDFIRRVLAKECPICLSVFPHSKMQSLTSCQCSVCCDCFQQHFTIVVRDKHIRDMVCPVCWEPDINDPEHLNSYFSTLDIQLRECLEPEVYDLFHKKLTEQALIKDPKFLWCSH
ncbi:E3 ubiquitin-protein ligase RNF31-like, partial [Scleropages formosus]